ncbi:nitric oxide reductase transcriptional regulator NorR [Stigmatella sp. ncwal1]|uniref:Nitric oxide reductase transcriptional regulator NorR n=1 Tax=Stigmatella ashevillensis TaxID=2995309 RepID=A0ABT5DNP5_9BACT|nr:nitric oxide reductase transcriptional regulator NorR [Stigmatella ashevillena]MDC0715204.1 nitric oxide reductase transcriptional regulator NorR [Stigmatella ashevillena]
MTSHPLLHALIPLVDDLSRDLPEQERYRRLLQALRVLLPCDAVALLRLEGEWLVPLSVNGLSGDTLGRRFRVREHPRFQVLLASTAPTRFPTDSPLPDPYDGLVQGASGDLQVHDCLGCPLLVDDQVWGLLTLDALSPGQLAPVDLGALQAFASLAAATVRVTLRIERLVRQAEGEFQRAEIYRLAAGERPHTLIGQSALFCKLMEDIALVGASALSVLISGETGVGKELVAQALHAASPRANRPLISLNCAALPESLVESELFGHVVGAFSGAVSDRRGKFELADGGTLLLDEVGELPLTVQAKLLRVLQSGQLQRLGSDREHRIDVRLIAATNRDLAEEVRQGRFRADLYHRLSVYPLHVPALRQRGSDVLLLTGYFLEENRSRLGLHSLRLSGDAEAVLLAYPWPGNVRELEHLVARSALKAYGQRRDGSRILTLSAEDFALQGEPPGPPRAEPPLEPEAPVGDLREAVEHFERRQIRASLERHQGNWASAARELGMDRANLRRLARRLGFV